MVDMPFSAATIERPPQSRRPLKGLIILILKLEVFLMPLWFLPVTFEAFEFNKQQILWGLTALAALLWLINALLIEKKIIYRRTPLDLPIAIFVLLAAIATMSGVDWYSSLLGFYGRFSDSWFNIFFLALFYFLVVAVCDAAQLKKIWRLFLLGTTAALTITLASLMGVGQFLFSGHIWLALMSARTFSPLGQASESVAVAAAIMLVLSVAYYSYDVVGFRLPIRRKIGFWLMSAISLAVLVLINFTVAWLVALICLGLLFGFALWSSYYAQAQQSSISVRLAPPLIIFLLSVVFFSVFAGGHWNLYQSIFKETLPQEAMLSAADTRTIVWGGLKQNPLFGFGPGNFVYAFSQNRPASFNLQPLWQLRFDKASAYLLELIVTLGFLGVAAYLSIIGIWLFVSFIFLKNLLRLNSDDNGALALAATFGAMSAVVSQLMSGQTVFLQFMFWFCLAIAIAAWRLLFAKLFVDQEISLHALAAKVAGPLPGIVVGISVLLCVGLWYAQVKQLVGDTYYLASRLNGNLAQLEKAAAFVPRRAQYQLALSRAYFAEVRADITALTGGGASVVLDSQSKANLQRRVQQSIAAADSAVVLAPNAVMSWEARGALYRDVKLIAVGSLEPAIKSFQRANELEPTNPVLLTELGKLFLIDNKTAEAVSAFQKAVALKPDYFDAYVGLAKTYEALSQPDKALVTLEQIITRAPNPELVYESGRLYYNMGNISEAIERFKKAVSLRPNYANAIYSLGLAYQKQGNNVLALEQWQKVLELSPNNEAVMKMIDNLGLE